MSKHSLAVMEGGQPDAPTQLKVLEQVVVQGDLSKMSTADRLAYYRNVCESLGLNPFTRPFDYISLDGKLTLYAKKDCTDQLRARHRVTMNLVSHERMDDLYIVTARATLPDGRSDEEIGAVSIVGLKGQALANAMMKAVTKAKRRVTLSVVGLGWLDETEIDTIPNALPMTVETAHGTVNLGTGEVVSTSTQNVQQAASEPQGVPSAPSAVVEPAKPAEDVSVKRTRCEEKFRAQLAIMDESALGIDDLELDMHTPFGFWMGGIADSTPLWAEVPLDELTVTEMVGYGRQLATAIHAAQKRPLDG